MIFIILLQLKFFKKNKSYLHSPFHFLKQPKHKNSLSWYNKCLYKRSYPFGILKKYTILYHFQTWFHYHKNLKPSSVCLSFLCFTFILFFFFILHSSYSFFDQTHFLSVTINAKQLTLGLGELRKNIFLVLLLAFRDK